METIKVIFENSKIKVEEIQSAGHASLADFWYDCEFDEWVTVTQGSAVLKLQDGEKQLGTGDNFYIPAHCKHRVASTSLDCEWLCVYVKG